MGERERDGLYSTEVVLGRLVEKDKLYQEYRKAMEETGDTVEPMRYVNENGRTVAADTSMEAVQERRKEYEKLLEEPVKESKQARQKVSLQALSREEGPRPLRKMSREMEREKPMTLSRNRSMGR